MVYKWCKSCASRSCGGNESSHRAQGLIEYRADFVLGGRYGKRLRKLFSVKEDATSFEYVTKADYKRGLFLPQEKSKTLLNELWKAYSVEYVDRYMRGSKEERYRLKAFLELFNQRPLHSICLNDWNKYVSIRLNRSISKNTLNRELTSLKIMFKWAVTNSYLKSNPFDKSKKFKTDTILVRWLNDAEIEGVLNECTKQGDLGLRDILVFALNTGFRKANLEQVTANDILNQRIRATRTKSGKSYEVPISNTLAHLINRLSKNSSGPLLDFNNFRNRFDNVIKDPTITLHTFRHTFAAQCLRRGIPIDRVCAWLGHHSVEFTRKHYGHLCPSQEAVEIELLNLGSKNVSPSVPLEVRDQGRGGETVPVRSTEG